MLGATAGEMILFGRARAVDPGFSDAELIAELARMFIAYLRFGDAEAAAEG